MNLVKILSTGNFSSRRDLARFLARLWSPGISLPAEILGKILAAGNFASRRDSRQDSRRDFGRQEFSFPPRIPLRFWPPGISFPAEILGKILAAGNFASRRDSRQDSRRDFGRREFSFPPRIPLRFWPPGISFPAENPAGNENPAGQNLAGILARFPAGFPAGSRSFFYKGGPCVAHKNRGMARNERLVSLAGKLNLFWLTFFCHEKLHHFVCSELVSFIILASVSCAVCKNCDVIRLEKTYSLTRAHKLELHSRNTYLRRT